MREQGWIHRRACLGGGCRPRAHKTLNVAMNRRGCNDKRPLGEERSTPAHLRCALEHRPSEHRSNARRQDSRARWPSVSFIGVTARIT